MQTKLRSFVKATSWRITGTLDTFILSWIITGTPKLAFTIAGTEVLTKIFLYWIHERIWNNVSWGIRIRPPTTPPVCPPQIKNIKAQKYDPQESTLWY